MHSLNLINAILFGMCAVLWLLNGLREQDILDYLLSALWLAGAVKWLVRYFKEKNKGK